MQVGRAETLKCDMKDRNMHNNVRLLLGKYENSPFGVKIHPDRVKERNRINKNVILLS